MIFAEDSGMKQGILAAAFLALSAGFASADYVIIVANVGGGRELTAVSGQGMSGMGGMRGMMGGGMAGMAGMRGGMGGAGSGGMMMGMQGMRGGQAQGMPPGGNQGGPPAGMGGVGSGGMMMGMQGMRGGMGGAGSGAGSGGMMMGMRGGMGGAGSGGMMMGMRGGMMGMMSLGTNDVDDLTDYVIAVVEVKSKANLVKALDRGLVRVGLPDRLGKSCQLLKNPSFGELFVITETSDKDKKAMPTVADLFNEKFAALAKEKASAGDYLDLAEWTLQHGLVHKFPEVMAKVVEADKGHSAAVAYLKIKAELDRKPGDDPFAATLRKDLLNSYKLTETPHYLLVHNSAGDTALEVQTHAEHLEKAFRGFYYWFALRGIALTVPQNCQVVVLTSKEDDFERLRKILTSGPIVVDGFFARRESLGVMHSQRSDDPYKALTTFWENWKGKGYQRFDLLENKNTGLPKNGVPQTIRQAAASQSVEALVNIAEAQMLALMLKALEQEAELATVSHEASRQLLFASGLLPRNVAIPEWILFGMGSFFETPLQSPWPTIGALSPYYLPRWRELKAKDPSQGWLEKSAVDTLKKVVTDGYFRSLPSDGKPDSLQHRLHEAALRKTRTVSWSLAYYLAQKHLDGLRQYFTELSKMPRDIELDDTVLLGCFTRAFGCVDGNNKMNEAKLKTLANDWYGYWATAHFESEQVMKEIREKIAQKVKADEENAKNANEQNNTQQGAGFFPPGMQSGMNPQQRGSQQGGSQRGGPQQRGPQQANPPQGGRVPPNNPGRTPPQPPTAPKQ
jgi:hypothetical protein